MIEKTIDDITTRIASCESLDERKRQELLTLLADLEREFTALPEHQAEHAESIAGFVGLSAREATRKSKDPDLLEVASRGLSLSIREFETTHRKLVETVNGISAMLSNLGI